MTCKVIVTNERALRAKYGAGFAAIRRAWAALVAADRARGVTTRVVRLDAARSMRRFGPPLADGRDPRQAKEAVDAVCRVLQPDYLLLLGSVDVVPHQDLGNPLAASDQDPAALGDLPYACEHGYSRLIADFVGPSRVVGRLPDITGGGDPRHLVALLRTAAAWRARPRRNYERCLGISAAVWRGSTSLTLTKLFGSDRDLQPAPPAGPAWPRAVLQRRAHFINCHGDTVDPDYYGEDAGHYPTAHASSYVAGKLRVGTVAAVECCYGAELYDPRANGVVRPMVNAYLASRAYGFFGSSTIAYGPAEGNGAADLLTQDFLRRVLDGASLGRAVLEARQAFVRHTAPLDPIDQKTLAQFSLMGDPSIHPVAPAAERRDRPPGQAPAPGVTAATARLARGRAARRHRLRAAGLGLEATVGCAGPRRAGPIPPGVRVALGAALRAMDAPGGTLLRFPVAAPAALRKGRARAVARETFYLAIHERTQAADRTPRLAAAVAHEVAGRLLAVRRRVSRS